MLKSKKHEFHAGYVQPIYLTEYKGRKFKIQKRELPSTEWDLLEQMLDDDMDCDYENYHWQFTLPSKWHCLKAIPNLVNTGSLSFEDVDDA